MTGPRRHERRSRPAASRGPDAGPEPDPATASASGPWPGVGSATEGLRIGRLLAGGLALRLARYPLQALFVLAVPPILGPEAYGVYAACVAVWVVAVEATDLGTLAVFGRLVPGLPPPAAAEVVRQLLWSRLALAAGPGTVLLTILWTPRPQDPLLFGLVAAAVLLVPLQQVLFGMLYARGQITRVMARDPLRSALSLLLVVPGYLAAGLVGAVGAIALAQSVLVAVGASWARPRPGDLAPPGTLRGLPDTLRFGLAAALPAALTTIALKLGIPLLSRAGRPAAEVAALDLAVHGLVLVIALAAYPFTALLPSLGKAIDAGRRAESDACLGRVVGRAAAAAALVVIALVATAGPVVHRLLGGGFAAVHPNLLLLVGAGVFPALVGQAGLAMALLARTPRLAVPPAVGLVLVAGLGALTLARPLGAMATAASLIAGLVIQAGLLLILVPRLASLVLRRVALGLAAALPALLLGGLEAARLVALPAGQRAAAIAAALLAAAWPLRRLLRG